MIVTTVKVLAVITLGSLFAYLYGFPSPTRTYDALVTFPKT